MAEFIIIPTSMYKGSWLERLEEELLIRGVIGHLERLWGGRVDKDTIYDLLRWRCWRGSHGGSICPAVVVSDDNIYLLMLDEDEEKYVKVLDLGAVLEEELRGVIRYSDCLARYGYDYPC
jgi:hypothetical protein